MTTMTKPLITQLDYPTKTKLNNMLTRIKGQLFNMPGAAYLSSIMFDMEIIWDLSCDTAYTTGKVVGWNPNFFLASTQGGRVFTLAHELWHPAYGHLTRKGNRCPDIWNIAADHVINIKLREEKYELDGIPIKVYEDTKYKDMTTEQVYDLLIQEGMIPFRPDLLGDLPMGGDIHEITNSKEVDELQSVLVGAQQAAIQANQAGSLPGEVSLYIDSFLNPKLNWKVLLKKYFTALSADDFSWRRPSRRYDKEYLPSMIADNGLEHLMYFLDVSGSVSDDQILRFNSEVRSIHRNLRPELLTLITFDTKIRDVYEFKKDQEFNEITVTGRGGTCLICVHDYIKQHKPTAAVVFSDMYVEPMASNPGSPILWIVMDNQSASVPFGKIIHLDKEDLAA